MEAPGTAPGSERFITTAIYRHIRLAPAPGNIGAKVAEKRARTGPRKDAQRTPSHEAHRPAARPASTVPCSTWRSSAASIMAAGARKAAGPRIFPSRPGCLASYPQLKETPLADPAQRTEWNVRDADACMIVVDAGGLGRFRRHGAGARSGAPLPQAALRRRLERSRSRNRRAALWLRVQKARHGGALTLAIGGPRESEAPGIYARAAAFIRSLIGLAHCSAATVGIARLRKTVWP